MSAVLSSLAGVRSFRRGSPSRLIAGARHVTRALRNVVEAWPEEVDREPVVVGRLLGTPVTSVMALTECLAVVATILPQFRVEPLDAHPPRTRLRVTLRPTGGLPVRIRARGDG